VASKRGHGLTDTEGVPVGRRVRLPKGAEQPYSVYINGVLQAEGEDYAVEGREIVFREPIVKEGKLGGLRWLSIGLGLVGSYRKHETVDVEYRLAGKAHLASDLEVVGE
jgi:hypothetical protein